VVDLRHAALAPARVGGCSAAGRHPSIVRRHGRFPAEDPGGAVSDLYTLGLVPAPKVADVDEFFARLDADARPHLETLRGLSLEAASGSGVVEELKWNFPAYTKQQMLWTLQRFKHHCSVRLPTSFFAPYRDEASAAGYEAIEGALKIRWDQDVPAELIRRLLTDRIADFDAGNTAWSTPGQHTGTKK
jgi:uncharacterized protein YdhG (YjbR/CyaY superfamily)